MLLVATLRLRLKLWWLVASLRVNTDPASPRGAGHSSRFTHELRSTREYLSSKALHLFLQTGLSIQKISLNIQGLRDDDVPSFPLVDKRNNSRNGFSQIFGDL